MNLYPFYSCVKKAEKLMAEGAEVYQQFNCAHCGIKQTMDVPDVFYKTGRCEECDQITNIEQDGCNYMLTLRRIR